MTLRHLRIAVVSILLVLAGVASAGAQAKKAPKAAVAQKTEQIDINSATKDQLMSLPGIGDALSQKIIDNRPYKMKNQLVSKKVIPQATYDKISGQIIAKQSAADSKAGGEK